MKRIEALMVLLPIALLGCFWGGESADDHVVLPSADPPESVPQPIVCAEYGQDLEGSAPTVHVVVDRSASMRSDFASTSRWQAVYQTLFDYPDGVIVKLDGAVRFGMSFFNDANGTGGFKCPNISSHQPAIDNGASLDEFYRSLLPTGGTPTGASIAAIAESLRGEVGATALVLATDGLPDTCDASAGDGSWGATNEAVAAVQYAHSLGFSTYVLSVGSDIALEHLQALANVGAGLPPGSQTSAEYYVALDANGLATAFDSIINRVRTCSITVDSNEWDVDGEGYQFAGIRVVHNGGRLEEGVHWRRVGNTIELLGATCDEILQDGTSSLSVEILCSIVVL